MNFLVTQNRAVDFLDKLRESIHILRIPDTIDLICYFQCSMSKVPTSIRLHKNRRNLKDIRDITE
jgi:hypothetical protein